MLPQAAQALLRLLLPPGSGTTSTAVPLANSLSPHHIARPLHVYTRLASAAMATAAGTLASQVTHVTSVGALLAWRAFSQGALCKTTHTFQSSTVRIIGTHACLMHP